MGARRILRRYVDYKEPAMAQMKHDHLKVIKKVRKEMQGKVERSVLSEVDDLIAELETLPDKEILTADYKVLVIKIVSNISRALPWICDIIDKLLSQ